ncbi:fumarylacetoacetase [Bradyrhizobiaceae bacterium SG-6C]|nr:fumarylacetoacetase [Bradyrhizobiaceae bacterium SG-6C]
MKPAIDKTHDPELRSFIKTANDGVTDFPIQNLPLGIFSHRSKEPGPGIAIGDQIFDLRAAHRLGLLPPDIPGEAIEQSSLNALFALGRDALTGLRHALSELLSEAESSAPARRHAIDLLVPMSDCSLHRPTNVGNYTDFYAGIYHAQAAGALLTPENPLPANYKWVPIAYHGRASSVQIGRGDIRRPVGQLPPTQPGEAPEFGPCKRLDFELELGFYVTGGNALSESIPLKNAAGHIAGYSLLNDWSARDIQRWEMFPLGPFLSKSFATSVSPWVVTADALAPFRVPAMERLAGDPRPLGYLLDDDDQASGGLDIDLRVLLSTGRMRREGDMPAEILRSNARYLYWTTAQMVAHHTVNGCNLHPGDLIGTGTISGPRDAELGSMLELTAAGSRPITLPNGEMRGFLEDGDEITFRGRCQRHGFASIGFGHCSGTIKTSHSH